MEILFTFYTKQANLIRRSTVLTLPSQLVFPGWRNKSLVTLTPVLRP
jgi:hypothetical protein